MHLIVVKVYKNIMSALIIMGRTKLFNIFVLWLNLNLTRNFIHNIFFFFFFLDLNDSCSLLDLDFSIKNALEFGFTTGILNRDIVVFVKKSQDLQWNIEIFCVKNFRV